MRLSPAPAPTPAAGLFALLLFVMVPAGPAAAQADTTAAAPAWLADHTPRGALWRAAAVPGWGQIYNRQYYKLPIVYGGLGGIVATTLLVNDQYLLYRHAYLYLARRQADGTAVFPEYADDYAELLAELDFPPESRLSPEEIAARRDRLEPIFRQNRDNLRRNRDLLYIGVGLFYGLTILDAYVNAHLLDFDVGEDLTVRVIPTPHGAAAALRLTL